MKVGTPGEMKEGFLFNSRKPRNVSHIWRNGDTLCRMWSTGGLKQSMPGWMVCTDKPPTMICHMCSNANMPERLDFGQGGGYW